ncbi:acyl-CoA thioesterase [uncultured Litoreibacter sp.]|uniref:acyl-CoA thioesterase n=1 Tax=uncultured Litoreibacter sp. TaxID=1392394 RepID=UPI00261BB3B9|nr:acyl-CoA thioesterase [uncultured Litoreibacter sp.]
MYPVIRLIKEFVKFRNAPDLGLTDTHVSTHRCWPWDIDLWMELNNGRTLTLYDLSRLPLAKRAGLIRALNDNKWGLTMAGASVRYRRRVRMFQKVEIRSRAVCWDDKFLYLEQSMWSKGEATSHILYRAAVTDKNGIVPTAKIVEAVAPGAETPDVPDWIAAWIDAEARRPWPPF